MLVPSPQNRRSPSPRRRVGRADLAPLRGCGIPVNVPQLSLIATYYQSPPPPAPFQALKAASPTARPSTCITATTRPACEWERRFDMRSSCRKGAATSATAGSTAKSSVRVGGSRGVAASSWRGGSAACRPRVASVWPAACKDSCVVRCALCAVRYAPCAVRRASCAAPQGSWSASIVAAASHLCRLPPCRPRCVRGFWPPFCPSRPTWAAKYVPARTLPPDSQAHTYAHTKHTHTQHGHARTHEAHMKHARPMRCASPEQAGHLCVASGRRSA